MNDRAFTVRAGAAALAQIRADGIAPSDVACVPAAAGGPKGLGLIPLDLRLFDRAQGWLAAAPRLHLVGASIGAWRMHAIAQADPAAALTRLAEGYIAQRYTKRSTPADVARECRKLAQAVIADHAPLAPGRELSVITARARGPLDGRRSRTAFARAALANLRSRRALATHFERVVFTTDRADWPAAPFDDFGLVRVPLTRANTEDALLASGSIPLVCDPVAHPPQAPRGEYWDGGLIDYHLLLPYDALLAPFAPRALVLYPHFVPHVTPGWLDKHLPWRRHARHAWLDRMLLIAPSAALLARLPLRKLPDRNDFLGYRDDVLREANWRRAMAECARMADEVIAWLERPDPTIIAPL